MIRLRIRQAIAAAWPGERTRRPSRRVLIGSLLRLPVVGGLLLASREAVAAATGRPVGSQAERTMAAIVGLMLPKDELPGGLELGIDRRLAATADPELKRSLAASVAWLDGGARRLGAPSFVRLDPARQELVLRTALSSSAEGARALAWMIRKQVFELYYTDPRIMAAFAYSGPPQPEGFPDFQEPPSFQEPPR